MIRRGLAALGLRADGFLRHNSPRLIYGAALAPTPKTSCYGSARSHILLPPGNDGIEEMVDYWRESGCPAGSPGQRC